VWTLVNHTRFAAERAFIRDPQGGEVWLVAVKATFTIGPDGSTAVADEQVPVCSAPEYFGEPGQSSLRYESDFVLSKRATDVLLHGHAYAPAGQPVQQLDVGLRVGSLAKTLRVFGRRSWRSSPEGLQLSEPEPFVKLPLRYEHAFGGQDSSASDPTLQVSDRRNPVGAGFVEDESRAAGKLACAIEDPANVVSSPKDRPGPAGFGPIARDWFPRVELAGTYDQAWEDTRRPLLPVDFNPQFCQCAPEDQQHAPYLRGGERVELEQLTPGGRLQFELPRTYLGFETRIAGRVRHHSARLHTLLLEPDASRFMLVWQAALPCHGELHTLLTTRIHEKRRIARLGAWL
jgi:hypothetical protein